MSNGRGTKEATPEQIKVAKNLIKAGKLGPKARTNEDNKAELDAFTDMVQNKLAVGMAGLLGAAPSTVLSPKGENIRKLKKKQNLKRAGASPGRIKAEFGTEMSRGGEVDVVDLTTEMEVNE